MNLSIETVIIIVLVLFIIFKITCDSSEKNIEGLNYPNGDGPDSKINSEFIEIDDINGIDTRNGADFGLLGLSGVIYPLPEPAKITPIGCNPVYNIQKGYYGDVPITLYAGNDLPFADEWGYNHSVYRPNTRTAFREVGDVNHVIKVDDNKTDNHVIKVDDNASFWGHNADFITEDNYLDGESNCLLGYRSNCLSGCKDSNPLNGTSDVLPLNYDINEIGGLSKFN
jgi:hypothetical protein